MFRTKLEVVSRGSRYMCVSDYSLMIMFEEHITIVDAEET